jgi:methylmalonyl-CoA/ethylmalonyl-CoA epimerase
MINAIDHIGIAVLDIEKSIELYKNIFEFEDLHREIVRDQMVEVASFSLGDVKIELTAATGENSPITKFIAKRGEGIHHIAFKSNDVNSDLDRLKNKNIKLVDGKAKMGAHEALIAFLHPKSTGGVLIELCQRK